MSIQTAESGDSSVRPSDVDHRIVVFAVPDDLNLLEEILGRLPELDKPTIRQIARALPGLIPGRLSRSQAAELAAGIRDLGVDATSIPESDIPDVSHAHAAHHLKVTENDLEVIDFREETRVWKGEEIELLSVGVIPSSAPQLHRSAPAAAMGSSHRSWNEGARLSAKKRPEAYVLFADGAALSLASDEMNYEYLANRLCGSSTANFTAMIRDLHELAPQAWVTPSTRSFLEHAPQRHYEFRGRDEFQRYTRFHALLRGQVSRHRP